MKVSEIVELLRFKHIGFSYLEVRSTTVEEVSDVLQTEKLEQEKEDM